MKRIRESETIDKTVRRKEQSKTCMASMRETIEQTVQRKQLNRTRIGSFELCSIMMSCETLIFLLIYTHNDNYNLYDIMYKRYRCDMCMEKQKYHLHTYMYSTCTYAKRRGFCT